MLNVPALVGAFIGAVLGAIVWALITAVTGFEVGYVAWGVGALIGFGAAILRSRGPVMGAICAVLAVCSIFVGKVISAQIFLKDMVVQSLEAQLTQERYDKLCGDATAFASLQGEEEYPGFMVEHEFTEASVPNDVPVEEVSEFKKWAVPMLTALSTEKPPFKVWRAEQIESASRQFLAEVPIVQSVVQSLSFIDLIFAILGVGTAYRIAAAGVTTRTGGDGTPSAPARPGGPRSSAHRNAPRLDRQTVEV